MPIAAEGLIMTKILMTMLYIVVMIFVALTGGAKRVALIGGKSYVKFVFPAWAGRALCVLSRKAGCGQLSTPGMAVVTKKYGSHVTLFDNLLNRLSPLTQSFVALHEEGHIYDQEFLYNGGSISAEVVADMYAIHKLGVTVEDVDGIFDELISYVSSFKHDDTYEAIDQLKYRRGVAIFRTKYSL